MEALGGDKEFADRFLAQHLAFIYYWVVVLLYIVSPAIAYDLNKNVEMHAFETYDKFLQSHADMLKETPAPQVAVDYYQNGDLFLFDAFQEDRREDETATNNSKDNVNSSTNNEKPQKKPPRRPQITSMYDVIANIRDDEEEHAISMMRLQRAAVKRKSMNE